MDDSSTSRKIRISQPRPFLKLSALCGELICSRALLVAFLFAIPAAIVGCGPLPPTLTFQSTQSDQRFVQVYDRACFSRSDNGEWEIVLVSDGLTPGAVGRKGDLHPSGGSSMSQIVHIRILWRPLRGSKPDTPSATNAVIDWYMLASDSPGHDDRLHYRGVGFVVVNASDESATIEVRKADMELADQSGRLKDPLGKSTLTAEFQASHNDGVVDATTERIRQFSTKSRPPTTEAHEGPPPRGPTGP
jgi:hypothetical protein